MAILTVFEMSAMTVEKYNKVIEELESGGSGKPKGRLHHVASLREDGGITVTDVWESAELLGAFGETLMPALTKAGVTPVEPTVQVVHNVIKG